MWLFIFLNNCFHVRKALNCEMNYQESVFYSLDLEQNFLLLKALKSEFSKANRVSCIIGFASIRRHYLKGRGPGGGQGFCDTRQWYINLSLVNNFLETATIKIDCVKIWLIRCRHIRIANRRKADSTIPSFDIILSSPNNVVTEVGRIFLHFFWAKMFESFDGEVRSTIEVAMVATVEARHSKEVGSFKV